MNTTHAPSDHAHQARRNRITGFAALAIVILIAALGCTAYWYFIASRYVTTDNAYASVEIAEVTPAVSGIVTRVDVVDTQWVNAGDVLVTLDDTDARLALIQAEADLALAKRRVESYIANDEGLNALVRARMADENRTKAQLAVAQANFERAKLDLSRRQDLVKSGSVSGEELSNAQTSFTQAQANLNAAKAAANQSVATRLSTIGNQKANAALIQGTSVETNPEVLLANARYQQAQVDLARTVIHAPIAGVVAKRQVQVGRKVPVGAPLLTIVPIDQIHVDANFKEGELRDLQIGQTVTVTSDLHGDDVRYHGLVTGISGGTGSAFSMIPAQNATGNWIKVVQRLPVRIELDPRDLHDHPLQVGLSMTVTIDTLSQEDVSYLTRARYDIRGDQG
ncbi:MULTISPECIES: HlyD family secretion protein [Vibrio]|uniref:HlyD family secretion protein n=1 Tax=Vibrio TaxID=662 RepID=UPI000B7BDC66|nr:EmrA/EmrK family multidrug efflux transporter periplasmic adaptor subunit [Vibrio anguillarum]NAW91375.1 HlyD family efflux transporter periplasmic adaptor subunit [Vibrio sp. V24_P1S3T111]NAX43325.1 HlyD family efflux transporter periplasmic adaptor subunit [Vibrio sp. V25_P4S6T154]NNN67776.1 HlyD family efflux transporter periplasmic adaptor subunit [Vibrio sp. 3-2(1)]NNN98968.1 HlyD family efflux transporter periplasmic adaptor subunit [Vibrio sp. B1-2]OXX21651.1 EmrA/EmrK family multidr